MPILNDTFPVNDHIILSLCANAQYAHREGALVTQRTPGDRHCF